MPTVVHLCFGYAAVVPGSTKPAGYSFLAELADTSAEQISIEAAQPKLDLGVLKDLSSKKIMLGVLDLGNPEIETADVVADRIRNGLKHVAADRLVVAPDCGMKYMPRHISVRKTEGDVRRGRDRAQGDQLSGLPCSHAAPRAYKASTSGPFRPGMSRFTV